MTINTSLSVSDIINFILLIIAVIGIFLTYSQIRQSFRTQKATFFKELYNTMFGDSDIRDIFYRIEYGEFTYDEKFHGSETEKMIDRLLCFSDLVCELYSQKIITDHEMKFFKYELSRIYNNSNIQGYLEFLDKLAKATRLEVQPFNSFKSYCIKFSV